jgi:hypothetical protein
MAHRLPYNSTGHPFSSSEGLLAGNPHRNHAPLQKPFSWRQDHNPHPDVVNNPPNSLYGERGLGTSGLASSPSLLNTITSFQTI